MSFGARDGSSDLVRVPSYIRRYAQDTKIHSRVGRHADCSEPVGTGSETKRSSGATLGDELGRIPAGSGTAE